MYSFEVSKSKISASEPQKMMVLCRFETMTLLMRHPVCKTYNSKNPVENSVYIVLNTESMYA